jgi:hypothetical protein
MVGKIIEKGFGHYKNKYARKPFAAALISGAILVIFNLQIELESSGRDKK